MNKEETEKEQTKIETAINNILRGMDIESAALILEKVILDNYIITKGRVNILHLAVRQILYFIENSKIQNVGDKNILDYVKENVKLKEQIKELGQKESILDKVTDKLKEYLRLIKQDGIYGYDTEIIEILEIIEGGNNGR